MSMMRRWSRTSDHSSTHREEEDADLEEFMRLVGTKQELKLFQGKTSASGITDHSSMSEISDSMGTSGFGSGSVLRSKALSHFRTLKETHNTLSESLSCSFVATDATGHEGHQPTVGTSLGSSASSSSRSYMPVVPSPLHTEQAPMSPVHIPSGQSYGSNVSHLVNARQHRRHHSTHHSADQQSHPIETSSEQIAFSSYPKDRQVELRRLSAMKDDEGETHTTRRGGVVPHSSLPQYSTRRHLSPEDLELFPSDIDRTTSQTSLNDTRIRGSTVESSGSRHGDRTSLLDDDDSLVFKMSELGYESPCSHSMAVHSPAEATRGHMSGGMNSGMMGGMMGGNGGRENEGGIVLHCPLTDTRHYARRWSTSISPSLQRMPTSPTQPTLSKEKKSPSSSEHDYSKEIKRTTDRHSTEESLAGHNSFYRDW
ncbi:hypothetical protein BDF14DRAFT_548342 [Spinellus fusiger]|nr:hypothetical protein BDF14DRAFT_548342 [Spinellus fusiger]